MPASPRPTTTTGRRPASVTRAIISSSASRRTRARSPSTSEVPAMPDRLYRSRDERVLFGVAGGIAEWLDVDPALVRIVFALLVITAGVGFLLYIVMALVIPEEPYAYDPSVAPPQPAGAAGAPAPGLSW